jgi:hypothetical protein
LIYGLRLQPRAPGGRHVWPPGIGYLWWVRHLPKHRRRCG